MIYILLSVIIIVIIVLLYFFAFRKRNVERELWSDWSAWSECDKPCLGRYTKTRTCLNNLCGKQTQTISASCNIYADACTNYVRIEDLVSINWTTELPTMGPVIFIFSNINPRGHTKNLKSLLYLL